MDRNADDPNPDMPPGASPQELEEALKWLEELAARQSLASDADKSALASLESPFSGLIESDEGDLPDWLREAPSAAAIAAGEEEGEIESRLDWLAKMAERESIEELPTLEWRHLSEPARDAALASLANRPEEDNYDTEPPIERSPIEPGDEPVSELEASEEIGAVDFTWDEESTELPAGEVPVDFLDEQADLLIDVANDIDASETIDGDGPPAPGDHVPEAPAEEAYLVETVEEVSKEHLLDALPPNEELPPIDDLDAAMAWIEELAASQDAPIEDVPSVADRALASKLMLEAGLSPDAFETARQDNSVPFGDLSLLEGNTPVNAFVDAEDFADTIILVETIIAEQAEPPQPPLERSEIQPVAPLGPEEAFAESVEPPADELSFDEAMAFLDGLASSQASLPDETTTSLESVDPEEQIVEEEAQAEPVNEWPGEPEEMPEAELPELVEVIEPPSETLLSEAPPWLSADEAQAEEPAPIDDQVEEEAVAPEWIEPMEEVAMDETSLGTNGHSGVALEEALRAVDSLALPAGVTLAEIDVSLRQRNLATHRRDLPAVLDWLETALAAPPPDRPMSDLVTADLIDHMPDDPDAVLDWLMQMAGDETVDSQGQASEDGLAHPAPEAFAETTGPAGRSPEGWTEADLLSMPDDPDEAIAWLEGLAAGFQPEPVQSPTETRVEQPAEQLEEPATLDSSGPMFDESASNEPVLKEPMLDEPVFAEPMVDELILDEPVLDEPVFDELLFDEPLFDEQPVVTHLSDDQPAAAQPVEAVPDEMPTPSSLVITRPRQRRGRVVQDALAGESAPSVPVEGLPPSPPIEVPPIEEMETSPDAVMELSLQEASTEVEALDEPHSRPRPLVRARPRRARKEPSEAAPLPDTVEALTTTAETEVEQPPVPRTEGEPPLESSDSPKTWIDLLKPLP